MTLKKIAILKIAAESRINHLFEKNDFERKMKSMMK